MSEQIERLLKTEEVAERLNVARSTASQLINRGQIESIKFGMSRRVRPEALEAFIRERTVATERRAA